MLLILKLRQSMVSAGNFVYLPLLTKISFQSCHLDFKLLGKYNKYAGNQTARDLFWFYFSSIFRKSSRGPLS